MFYLSRLIVTKDYALLQIEMFANIFYCKEQYFANELSIIYSYGIIISASKLAGVNITKNF